MYVQALKGKVWQVKATTDVWVC